MEEEVEDSDDEEYERFGVGRLSTGGPVRP